MKYDHTSYDPARYDSARYDPMKASTLMKELSELCDPVSLMSWIAKRTAYGRRPGPDPWGYTRLFFTEYGVPQRAEQVAALFEPVGVRDEVDASVWLSEHGDQIP